MGSKMSSPTTTQPTTNQFWKTIRGVREMSHIRIFANQGDEGEDLPPSSWFSGEDLQQQSCTIWLYVI